MSFEISAKNKVIGLKQSKKMIKEGRAKHVYIASDADSLIKESIVKLCGEQNIPYTFAPSMEILGRTCKIDVGAAVVTELV